MGNIIKFFTADLSALLFPPEKTDTFSGYRTGIHASAEDAWIQDCANMRRDAQRAISKVMYGSQEKELS